jgi:hypothetical protein
MLRLAKKPNRVTIDIDFGGGFFFVIMIDMLPCFGLVPPEQEALLAQT